VEIPNPIAHFSMVQGHLLLFALFLLALPVISFLCIKLWTTARASKVPHNTLWFVPDDLDSHAAHMHFSMRRNSMAFARARGRRNRIRG
jgi:hypothetical protein